MPTEASSISSSSSSIGALNIKAKAGASHQPKKMFSGGKWKFLQPVCQLIPHAIRQLLCSPGADLEIGTKPLKPLRECCTLEHDFCHSHLVATGKGDNPIAHLFFERLTLRLKLKTVADPIEVHNLNASNGGSFKTHGLCIVC